MQEPEIGRYRHYKNKDYDVIGIANHTETMEKYVVYRALYGTYELWVRPLAMFMEMVELNGKSVPRFQKIES